MVLPGVAVSPSAPPSATSTWLSCQTARRPSTIEPGMIASKLVETAHVAPIEVGVAVHGAVMPEKTKSVTVAASEPEEPLPRSVMRTVDEASISPV